jgi:hypothetical protein
MARPPVKLKEKTMAKVKKSLTLSEGEVQQRLTGLRDILTKLPVKGQPSTPGKA